MVTKIFFFNCRVTQDLTLWLSVWLSGFIALSVLCCSVNQVTVLNFLRMVSNMPFFFQFSTADYIYLNMLLHPHIPPAFQTISIIFRQHYSGLVLQWISIIVDQHYSGLVLQQTSIIVDQHYNRRALQWFSILVDQHYIGSSFCWMLGYAVRAYATNLPFFPFAFVCVCMSTNLFVY